MTEVSPRTVLDVNGVPLCVQTFGEAAAPALLLVPGAAASMDWWENEFCERLAAGLRFVIRYDQRDTGQSVTYEPGHPDYADRDLLADALGILDTLGVDRAHVVAISAGGVLAQRLALDHADRVLTLTLVSTTPGGSGLPPPDARVTAHFADPAPDPDWSDREAVIDYVLADLRAYAGWIPVDEDRARALVGEAVDRTIDMRSSLKNHYLIEGGEPLRARLHEITAPTLVLHGTDDPLFPFAHGEALAAEIPGARLVPLEGVGHEMPPRQVWDVVVRAVLDHTAR